MVVQPVILCGGIGTRLSPTSTPDCPKQFLPYQGGPSLFEQACARSGLIHEGPPAIVTTAALEPLARKQAPKNARYIIEPVRRNTAAAIALAARSLTGEMILGILPSDHVIADQVAFIQAIATAGAQAAQGAIVLLGIPASSTHTGYGYIRADANGRVAQFAEKPDAATAATYRAQGWLWNSGIVVARADIMMMEFIRLAPAYVNGTPYSALPPLPFDTVILERTDKARVIIADMGWHDAGQADNAAAFQQIG